MQSCECNNQLIKERDKDRKVAFYVMKLKKKHRLLSLRFSRSANMLLLSIIGTLCIAVAIVVAAHLSVRELVEQQIKPTEIVHRITANYNATITILVKYDDGVMDGSSATSALDALIDADKRAWSSLGQYAGSNPSPKWAAFMDARAPADTVRQEMKKLLLSPDREWIAPFRTRDLQYRIAEIDSQGTQLLTYLGERASRLLTIMQIIFAFAYLLAIAAACWALLLAARFKRLVNEDFSEPMNRMMGLAAQTNDGDLAPYWTDLWRRDEIGSIGRAIAKGHRESRRAIIDQEARRRSELALTEQQSQYEVQRANRARQVTEKIESQEVDLGQLSNSLTSAARSMQLASSDIHEEAQSTRENMTASAAYIEQISVTMDAISSRGQALVESFRAIEQLVQRAEASVSTLAQSGEQGRKVSATLVSDSAQTAAMVSAITELARRTNSLAINASIEAERLDDGDGGFAVIAREVRLLARQCQEVARTASEKLNKIANSAGDTGSYINAVDGQLSDFMLQSREIASIVDLQARSNREVMGQLAEIRAGYDRLCETITDIFQSATEAETRATELLAISTDVMNQSEQVGQTIDALKSITQLA